MISIIQYYVNELSELTKLDHASIKVLVCTLLSYPVGIVFKRLPDRNYTLKNLFIVSVSAFYVFGICNLRSGFATLFIAAMGSYFITRYLSTPNMPWINFLFLMVHLLYNHARLQFFAEYDHTAIDISGAQMILVMKLSAFGWSVYDGKQAPESLTEYNRSRAIKKHPNILPFISYSFFYASLLTGPAFDYADYDRFIRSTLFDDVPEEKRPGTKVRRRIPKSGKEATFKLLQGFFWAFLLLQSPKYADMDYMYSSSFMDTHGFLYRVLYMWVLGFTYRLKYYTIWLIAEGACILCGIGYNGIDPKTGESRWDRVQNIDPCGFETAQNVRGAFEAWNQNTNKWLKHYVYLRVVKPGKKPGFKSTVFTFLTSAAWHGTMPGYYLTFLLGAFLQTIGKYYRRNIRPLFLTADGSPKPTKRVYDLVCWFNTQVAVGFLAQPFVILDLDKSLYCWGTVYFWLVVVVALTFFIYQGPFAKYFKSKRPKKPVASADVAVAKGHLADSQLSAKENRDVSQVVKKKLEKEYDAPALGIPSFDVFQNFDKDELDEDIKHLHEAWDSFKSRKLLQDDDFEGLREAYRKFSDEINSIFHKTKEEIVKEKGKISEELEKEKEKISKGIEVGKEKTMKHE
ncbi:uncharacterized protein LODBEIA_P37030 [Lodderomyces beijingensis]|uniref:Lysophospholipid acyltransferase n=1 Tax=Lodderomyces beijingensis TaxID=1775926 RepID=A0ABP0ZMX2_9ASCO